MTILENLKLPAMPTLDSLKDVKLPSLPALPSLKDIKLPSLPDLKVISVEDLKNIKLPSIQELRSKLSTEEAKAAGIVALGITASAAFVVLVRRADRHSPEVEIITLQDFQQLGTGGLLRDFGSFLITPTATAVRVTGYGDRISTLPRGLFNLIRLTDLNLCGNSLTQVPKDIGRLCKLQNLDLGGNQLTSLPEEIGALTALTSLNAMGNQLESLPDSLGALTGLIRLGLKSNNLKSLPKSIGNLKEMKELFLTDNCLESLPEEIGGCQALVKLQASHNALRALPASLGSLQKLELLRVACCDIAEMPQSIASAPALAWLSLATNPVSKAPSARSRVPTISLNDLEIGKKLGDGASGEVFEAIWKGNKVAYKLFRADRSPDGHSADEIAIACALSEKHLVKVLAKIDSPLGIVMEYVQGAPLAEKPNSESLLRCRWAPDASFSIDYVLSVAAGVASALEAMHSRGLIHGDVYAHNVLSDDQGNAVLHDYGASFYYPKGPSAAVYEGQEARAFGLMLRDLLTRMEIGFEGMENALDVQKQMLLMVQQCVGGPPGSRPKMSAIARKLLSLQKSSASRNNTPRSESGAKNSARSANGSIHA